MLSGDRVTVDASYARTDNEVVFINTLPNPSNDLGVNLTYRRPLQRGAGNVEYHSLEQAARAQIASSQAQEFELRDQLANQVAALFYGLATIEVNLDNTREGIDRLERLLQYVSRNQRLGISEEKDILQSQARLDRKHAELVALETARNQQLFNLNRLMNLQPRTRFMTKVDYSEPGLPARDVLDTEVFNYSPAMNRARAAKTTAESNIKLQQDNKKDVIDVFLSVGARNKSGPTASMDIDESDLAGTLGLEYRAALDKRGLNASYQQSLLDRDIADNQIKQLTIDLNNEIERLLGLVSDQKKAIASNTRTRRKADDAVETA